MKRLICLKILVLLLIPILPFAQRLLVDDYHGYELGNFEYFYDTLRNYGIEIHFVSEDCWSILDSIDLLQIQSPGYDVEFPDTDFFEIIKEYFFNNKSLIITHNSDSFGVEWSNWLICYMFYYYSL